MLGLALQGVGTIMAQRRKGTFVIGNSGITMILLIDFVQIQIPKGLVYPPTDRCLRTIYRT